RTSDESNRQTIARTETAGQHRRSEPSGRLQLGPQLTRSAVMERIMTQSMRRVATWCWVAVLALLAYCRTAAAESPAVLRNVGIDQHLNEQVPLNLDFTDESGNAVKLGD